MRGKKAIGVGYVTYPYDVDFFKYKETCFKSRTVSIFTEDSEVYPRVKIGQNLLSKVIFPNPENGELLGSMVVYVRKKNSSIPIVVAVFDLEDRGADLLPGQWKLDLHTESEGVSLIQGMPEDGTLDIIVHSEKSEGSELVVRATSKNKNSKIKIESDSAVEVVSSSLVSIQSELIKVLGKEIHLNGGDEGVPVSTRIVDKLNAIEKDINSLKASFSTWVPALGDGGTVLYGLTRTWSSQSLSTTTSKDIENEKIKQSE